MVYQEQRLSTAHSVITTTVYIKLGFRTLILQMRKQIPDLPKVTWLGCGRVGVRHRNSISNALHTFSVPGAPFLTITCHTDKAQWAASNSTTRHAISNVHKSEVGCGDKLKQASALLCTCLDYKQTCIHAYVQIHDDSAHVS